jgi:hypothetical protein
MAVDQDSSDWVLILRWALRVAALFFVLHGISVLGSHPSAVYGPHGSRAAQCPQVLTYTLKGTGLPSTKNGAPAPDARSACAAVTTSDARSAGIALGGAVALVAISLIPLRDKRPPAPGWVKSDGRWYPPTRAPKGAPRTPVPDDVDEESPPDL